MVRLHTITLVFLFATCSLNAQNNCYNTGFENGTWDGYDVFNGFIGDNGLQFSPGDAFDQLKIVKRIDGSDEIAAQDCIVNSQMPVVGDGLGEYALRLGNKEGGKRAAKASFDLTVTSDVNFLVLNYAIVVDDPDHEVEEQPTFSMTIKDEDGGVLPCGEYSVIAGNNIEGFENCGTWRVRPWTSAGFELQSFLGQTVTVEIITTDCTLGGHGGYAYIDLTCRPLEMVLDNYCPDETYAYFTVTPGFESYLWSTGETNNQIEIENPVPGTEYSVTVTSANGCTLTLVDTLPFFETIPLPVLEPFPDTSFCQGSSFWYVPQGENLDRVELIGSGLIQDSVLINALLSRTYQFVAKDEYGCISDTIEFTVTVSGPPDILMETYTLASCEEDNATIQLTSENGESLWYSLDGENYNETGFFSNLASGVHKVYARNEFYCYDSAQFFIDLIPKFNFDSITVRDISCHHDKGRAVIHPSGGTEPFEYSIDGQNYVPTKVFNDLPEDQYTIWVKDAMDCLDSVTLEIKSFAPPQIESITTADIYCDQTTGSANILMIDPSSSYEYFLNNLPQDDASFVNLPEGSYYVMVIDTLDCIVEDTFKIDYFDPPSIIQAEIVEYECGGQSAKVFIEIKEGSSPVKMFLNGDELGLNTTSLDLPFGTYTLFLEDENQCVDSTTFEVYQIEEPIISALKEIEVEQEGSLYRMSSIVDSICLPASLSINGKFHNYQSEMEFTLNFGTNRIIIKDACGCIYEEEIIAVEKEPLFFPNVLSKHSANDNSFLVGWKNDIHIYEVNCTIYDRWGSKVYEGNVVDPDQEATFHIFQNDSRLSPGVYVYRIETFNECGASRQYFGDVTIVN